MASRARTPVNLTLGLCIAGGLAAGIALARPASDDGGASAEATPAADVVEDGGGLAYEYPSVSDGDDAGDDAVAESAEASSAEPASITIADFAFGSPISVEPGAEIVVTNLDGAPHSVTADGGEFNSGVLDQDQSSTITAPTAAGTYTFFCIVHPSMRGEFTVG